MGIRRRGYEKPSIQRFDNSNAFIKWVTEGSLSATARVDQRAEKLREFADQHIVGDRQGVEAACRELGLSTSARQARRLFKTTVGTNFRRYSKQRRLAFAAIQLEETQQPVKVIALEIGYRRPADFTRSFRELFRLSPLEFRRVWARRACTA